MHSSLGTSLNSVHMHYSAPNMEEGIDIKFPKWLLWYTEFSEIDCSESLLVMTKNLSDFFKVDLMSLWTLIWFTHQWLSSISALQVFLSSPSNSGSAARADALLEISNLSEKMWIILCGQPIKASLCLHREPQWVWLLHLACMECIGC